MKHASDDKDRLDEPDSAPQAAPPRRNIPMIGDHLDSRDLFIGTREIMIRHGAETYRLRLTAQNKLIMTK